MAINIVSKVKFGRLSCYQRRGLINSSRNLRARAEEKKSQDSIDNVFKKSSKQGPVTWLSLALVALAGGGLVFYVRNLKEEKELGNKNLHASGSIVRFFICYIILRLPLSEVSNGKSVSFNSVLQGGFYRQVACTIRCCKPSLDMIV